VLSVPQPNRADGMNHDLRAGNAILIAERTVKEIERSSNCDIVVMADEGTVLQ